MAEDQVESVGGSQHLGRYRSQAASPSRREEHSLWELSLEGVKPFDRDHEPLARPLVGCSNEAAETALRSGLEELHQRHPIARLVHRGARGDLPVRGQIAVRVKNRP